MNPSRKFFSVISTVLVLTVGVVMAQRPARPGTIPKPQAAPRNRQPCDFGEPRTRLEQLDLELERVIVRGSTTVGFVTGRNGTIRVEAIEIKDEGRPATRVLGVVVTLRETTRPDAEAGQGETRSFMDYEEIDPLLKGLDTVAKTDDTTTKLANFEAHYSTRGELEIAGFRQTPGGAVGAAVSGGDCERIRILLSLEDLAKFRYMISQAKARLDEIT